MGQPDEATWVLPSYRQLRRGFLDQLKCEVWVRCTAPRTVQCAAPDEPMYNSLAASQICSFLVKLKCSPRARSLMYCTNSPPSQPLTEWLAIYLFGGHCAHIYVHDRSWIGGRPPTSLSLDRTSEKVGETHRKVHSESSRIRHTPSPALKASSKLKGMRHPRKQSVLCI